MAPNLFSVVIEMKYLFTSFVIFAESLPSISAENNGLVGKARGRSLFQTREQEKDNICLTTGCVKAGKRPQINK